MADPTTLAAALAELIARKGLARVQGNAQLINAWKKVAGEKVAASTRVIGLQRSIFEVGVGNSALLSELATFQKPELLKQLQAELPNQKIRDLKFKLKSEIQK